MTTRSACFGSDRVIVVRVLIGTISLKWGDVMKRVTSLLGAFLLLGVLAGCGGGGSNTSTSNNGNNGGSSNGGSSPLPAGTELLYVGDSVGVIHGFGVDPGSGKLTPLPSVAVTNQAAAADVGLAADSGGMVLYATSAGLGGPNVTSFMVDQKTGTLTANTGQTLPVPPRKLAAAPGGGTSGSACCARSGHLSQRARTRVQREYRHIAGCLIYYDHELPVRGYADTLRTVAATTGGRGGRRWKC